MTVAEQLPLLMPPLPPPIGPGLRVQCRHGAVPASYGFPVAEVVAVGPVKVAVRILGEPHTVRRIDPRLLEVFMAPLTVWHGYRPACIRGCRDRHGDWRQVTPAPGWAWITWTLAEHLRGDLNPALDLAPGEHLPDPGDVHPDDLDAFRTLRVAPVKPRKEEVAPSCPGTGGTAAAHPGSRSAGAASAASWPTRTSSPRRSTSPGSGSKANASQVTAHSGCTGARTGTASTARPNNTQPATTPSLGRAPS